MKFFCIEISIPYNYLKKKNQIGHTYYANISFAIFMVLQDFDYT